MRLHRYLRYLMAVLLAVFAVFSLTAAEHHGKVLFGGLPVPGATVTATQGDKKVVAVTNEMGLYSFPDLAEGTWSIQTEMQGFTAVKQDVNVAAAPAPATVLDFELKMLPIAEMNAQTSAPVVTGLPPATAGSPQANAQQPAATVPGPAANTATPNNTAANTSKDTGKNGKNNAKGGAPAASSGAGFQRADVQATSATPPAPASDSAPAGGDAAQSSAELSQRATDGYLVNGSSVNGASSNFGLNPAIGNNRRGPRSLYNGNIGFNLDNSSLDARQFSVTGVDTPKPQSTRFTGLASFGGPLRIPHVLRNGPNYTVNYQWTRNRSVSTLPYLLPTQAERNGDFSQVQYQGKPVQLVDFPNNIIPPSQISPQARALLNLYPLPNFTGNSAYNYQIPLISPSHVDAAQARANKQLGRKNSINGTFGFSSTRSDSPSVLGFLDTTNVLGFNTNIQWRHTYTPRLYGTFTFNFSRQSFRLTPFFQNRVNIAGQAGITGDNQAPVNWGPPALNFAGSNTQGISDGEAAFNRNMTNTAQYDSTWNHGRHNFSFGADFRRQQFNYLTQTDPRGTFTFTNTAEGYDFASFLLGIPAQSSIAFGNADKYFRSYGTDAYFQDDWRVSPGLTMLLGMRWEYNAPITELYGRLVNLDVGPGFSAVAPVVANDPIGALTGIRYPDSLVHPDKHEFLPRVGLSWRPISGSSMVVKAGYGIAYNTSVYQSIAYQMSQQSPLSKSLSVANTPADPLTLANGFNAAPNVTTNNFAIDPNFRVGYIQNWQASIQRDLPASLQMTVTYNGIKGTRQPQMFYPNTFAPGAVNPCLTCPSGYQFLASNGNSTREAGSLQMRRRLHNGFTATLTYTYAKAIDDSSGLGGGQFGSIAAQNWLDLSAERGRSSFDQRHLAVLSMQYTTGQGIGGGTLVSGWRGQLLKEWTIADAITVGTGLPLTPVYPVAVGVTGFNGIRPNYTGISVYNAPPGLYLNPLAYTAPTPGQWGNAGRNSITGPSQFFLNGNMARTFRLNDRFSIDLSLQATNVLNHVTFPRWGTTVGTTQFGLPGSANQMRTVLTNLRMRF